MRMRRRAIPIATMAATVIAALGVMARPAGADGRDVVVGPGDNVQAALSAAVPGTTVKLEAGTYHQFLVMPAGITLEGSGTSADGGTVLDWPASGANPCWNGFNALVCMASHDRVRDLRVDTTNALPGGNFGIGTVPSSTATTVEDVVAVATALSANDGIFLAGTNAAIRGTYTSGFHEGILFTAVGGQIEDNVGQGNCSGIVVFDFGLAGFFGPLGQASNVTVVGNREQDQNALCGFYGGAGIFLLGAPHSSVRNNVISSFNGGAIVTDSAYSTITGNAVRDSCLGIDVLNDGLPAPDGPADHDAVRGNDVTGSPANDCYTPGHTFATGIRLDGATNATAAGNEVQVSLHTAAVGPVDGIFVNSQPTIFGSVVPPPQNVSVTGNEVHEALNGSTGYDIAWDGSGTGISLAGNECGTSIPAGLCGVE
jgi:parallel beta-helix repeat protein